MEKRTIGSFIAALRKAKGLTQRQLAEQLNVSDKAVSRWERDEALPDLMLIPVLADIFGVTSDELLRGQRDANEMPTPQAEEKSKKQLKYLLNKTKTDYQIRTLLSVLVAVLGVIAAAILNLAFLRAIAGFWVGCIFFITAAVMQTVFYIQTKAKLNTEEFDEDFLTEVKKSCWNDTYWGIAVTLTLFAFALPLARVRDAYWGLTLWAWLGCNGHFQPAWLVLIAAGAIWWGMTLKRSGKLSGPKRKLQLLTALILAAVLAVTLAAQGFWMGVLEKNNQWTGQATTHESVEDFIRWMQTPLTSDGKTYEYTVAEQDEEGNLQVVYYPDAFTATDRAEKQYCFGIWRDMEVRFVRLNHTVRKFDFGHDEAIYSYTDEQLDAANHILNWMFYPIFLIYPIEIAAAVLLYRKKAKRLLLGEKLSAKLTDVGQ